ncbi:hypothetical protein Y032_0732g1916 [Ancylostoma ceylanicum]|uniref:Uncharacterized protein n=1 Tax=Ancylostoma ceylanicum TaxID=53326 RepID=A0A016WGT6_9BILA|nr:hypothetical protein Y032_0732g1916 [Ancylostoma ceylanicum]
MGAICKEFYTELLSLRSKVPLPALPRRNERPPEVLISEAPVLQGVQREYIEILREANTECFTEITLFNTSISIPVSEGVK